MVRKWSYLETRDLDLDMQSFESTSQLYHFKVFRKTTRFKKFNKGITRMVRKNYSRRKHRTNWLVLSYITKSWVTNYLKMRQFERFYSALGRFQFDTFSSNFDIFSIKLNSILNHNGINIVSCSKKVLEKHTNQSYGAGFLKNPTKNTNSAVIQVSSLRDISLSTDIYPNLVNLENSLFPYDDIAMSSVTNSHVQSLDMLTSNILSNTLQVNSSIYSLLISLTLLNTQGVGRF
jgi:hypothetical protein